MAKQRPLFQKWLAILLQASEGQSTEACASCGASSVRAVFVGDPASRVGYGCAWCDSCLRGIRMSRMRIPETVEIIPFGLELSQWPCTVPAFHEVYATGSASRPAPKLQSWG